VPSIPSPTEVEVQLQGTPAFDVRAVEYDKAARVQDGLAKWVAEWLPNCLGRVFELGVGTGLFSEHVLRKEVEFLGCDASPVMVSIARSKCPKGSFEVRDWSSIDPSWATGFDWVVSSAVLQWSVQPIDLMSNLRRVVRQNGRMLHGLFVDPTLVSAPSPAHPVVFRSIDEWSSIAECAGMRVVRAELSSRDYSYPNALSFFREIHQTGAYVPRRVTASALRRYIREWDITHPAGFTSAWTFARLELECL